MMTKTLNQLESKRTCLYLILFLFQSGVISSQNFGSSTTSADTLEYKILCLENKTFGYNIYINSKLFLHQTTIPCLAGFNGFKNKEDAQKVAVNIISKIKNGEMPPAITEEELKKLNINYSRTN